MHLRTYGSIGILAFFAKCSLVSYVLVSQCACTQYKKRSRVHRHINIAKVLCYSMILCLSALYFCYNFVYLKVQFVAHMQPRNFMLTLLDFYHVTGCYYNFLLQFFIFNRYMRQFLLSTYGRYVWTWVCACFSSYTFPILRLVNLAY